jgi:hypothetical protein
MLAAWSRQTTAAGDKKGYYCYKLSEGMTTTTKEATK